MCHQGKENKLNQKNVSKLQIIQLFLSFKAEKNIKKQEKKKGRSFTAGKKTENCDSRTYDIIIVYV